MTLHTADARLRAAEYGVRVVPVKRRGQAPYTWCSYYGDATREPHDSPIRFVCYPGEEFYFHEDGLFCRECYMRLAGSEQVAREATLHEHYKEASP